MKNISLRLSLMSSLFLLTAVPCFSASVNSHTERASSQLGASAVSEITFAKGSSDLTDPVKQDLQTFISDSLKKGSIKSVSVAAWSDQ